MELNVLERRVDISRTNCDQCVCMVQCCFTSTETIVKIIRDGEPKTATSTFTQLLNSDELLLQTYCHWKKNKTCSLADSFRRPLK